MKPSDESTVKWPTDEVMIFNMKKYRRLVLLVVAVISAVGLFMYRAQYLQLRETFELLSIYSPATEKLDCLTLNVSRESEGPEGERFARPLPSWLWTGERFVYSGFWTRVDERRGSATVLAAGETSHPLRYSCHVWFDHRDAIFSLEGSLSASVVAREAGLVVHELNCEFDWPRLDGGRPYMFILTWEGSSHKSYVPLYTGGPRAFNLTALCVLPDRTGYSKEQVIEFLSYYTALNVSRVIVYDRGILAGVLRSVERLGSLPSVVSRLSVLPWNFPYDSESLERDLVERDCIYRTAGEASLVGILPWDAYIIPHRGLSFVALAPDKSTKTVHYRVVSKVCCENAKDPPHALTSWPIVLKKTTCLESSPENVHVVSRPDFPWQGKEVNLNQMAGQVHLVRSCTPAHLQEAAYDSSALKYMSSLMDSKLLKIWRSGILFTTK